MNKKNKKGITLITLIIVIIVILILVAVSVRILIDSDLIGTAEKTANLFQTEADKESNLSVSGIAVEDGNTLEEYYNKAQQVTCIHNYVDGICIECGREESGEEEEIQISNTSNLTFLSDSRSSWTISEGEKYAYVIIAKGTDSTELSITISGEIITLQEQIARTSYVDKFGSNRKRTTLEVYRLDLSGEEGVVSISKSGYGNRKAWAAVLFTGSGLEQELEFLTESRSTYLFQDDETTVFVIFASGNNADTAVIERIGKWKRCRID